jgi:transmembrane sensor
MANDREARQAQIVEQASMWLEKLERAINKEDIVQLRRWLKRRAHREAIVERCKRWHGEDIRAVLGEMVPAESFVERAERRYDRMVITMVLAVMAMSATTVLVATVRVWSKSANHHNLIRSEAMEETGPGEHKRIKLPDGSTIVMNERAWLQVSYIPNRREVSLLRGEVTFNVVADDKRAFIVYAGSRQFDVVTGAATFDVERISKDNAKLVVASGQVEVPEPRESVKLSPALVREHVESGGHTFIAPEVGSLGPAWYSAARVDAGEIEKRMSWQQGLKMQCGMENGTVGAYYVCSTAHH